MTDGAWRFDDAPTRLFRQSPALDTSKFLLLLAGLAKWLNGAMELRLNIQ